MITVEAATFEDRLGMPEAHKDERRTITEQVFSTDSGKLYVTRIQVTATEALLGNHSHTFEERFTGRGPGVLTTAPEDNPADTTSQELPKEGWKVVIPAGVVHAFQVFVGTVLISERNQSFRDQGEDINTFPIVIVS